MSNMTVLDNDMIADLLQGQRTRGDYDTVVRDFLASGAPGIRVPLDSGALAGKTPDQAKTGLENARKRTDSNTGQLVHQGAQNVKVVKKEDIVYLIDTSKVAGAQQAQAEAQAEVQAQPQPA
jgi:hypothetical protein